MKACASFGALALLVGLIGCAAVPQYPNKVPADTACIVGDAPSYLSSASDGQATVEIREIDGAPVGAHASRCVPPGIHRLGVSAVYNRQAVQDYVELGLDGGRQYRLRANLRGISFVFQLIDVTATPAINVAQFSLKADYAPESYTEPVYVYYPAYPGYALWGGYAGYGGYSWANDRHGRYWNGRRQTYWNDGRNTGAAARRPPGPPMPPPTGGYSSATPITGDRFGGPFGAARRRGTTSWQSPSTPTPSAPYYSSSPSSSPANNQGRSGGPFGAARSRGTTSWQSPSTPANTQGGGGGPFGAARSRGTTSWQSPSTPTPSSSSSSTPSSPPAPAPQPEPEPQSAPAPAPEQSPAPPPDPPQIPGAGGGN